MHQKEFRQLNEQFKLREKHLVKKYKRVKKRFNQALHIIELQKRELERYRFDNNDIIGLDEMRTELLDMSRKQSTSKVRTAGIPRS